MAEGFTVPADGADVFHNGMGAVEAALAAFRAALRTRLDRLDFRPADPRP